MNELPEPRADRDADRAPRYGFRSGFWTRSSALSGEVDAALRQAAEGLLGTLASNLHADWAELWPASGADPSAPWVRCGHSSGEPPPAAGRALQLYPGVTLRAPEADGDPARGSLELLEFPVVGPFGCCGLVRLGRPYRGHLGEVERRYCEQCALGLGCVVDRAADVPAAAEAERLHEAQKLTLLGSLARGVAHDFNNLLTVLLGHVQLIGDAAPDDTAIQDLAGRANEAIDVASSLAHQLVDFARSRAAAPSEVDCHEVIGRLDRLLPSLLGERRRLVVDLPPEPVRVRADAVSLAQVLLNLVVNARDALPAGGEVRIATARLSGPHGPLLRLRVRDDGVGMDETVRARIFEPLFTTKGPERGSGLGMPTVLRIVREAGGDVEVHSSPGHGTTVDVLLPIVEDG